MRHKLPPLLIALLALTGCTDHDAREYALRLATLLTTYDQQLQAQVTGEQHYYHDAAQEFRKTASIDTGLSLELDREEQSRELEAQIQEQESVPTLARLQQHLRSYGEHEFTTARAFLEEDKDPNTQYLANIDDLNTARQKVQALTQTLKDLASPMPPTAQFNQLKTYLSNVKIEINRPDCATIQQNITAQNHKRAELESRRALPNQQDAQIAEIDRQLETIATQTSTLVHAQQTKGCSTQ